jgi:hypothetical protein
MPTDKKHIAVYLDLAVEQALIAFCEQKGLISKKGFMYSAGVNAALTQFFEVSGAEESNTPQSMDNIPGNVPDNIPFESIGIAEIELPEAAEVLNRLKAKRKKATASLADIEAVLEMIGK